MEMENLSFIAGVIGNIVSVLLYLSSIGTFARIVKRRSTEEFDGLPYIVTFLDCSLWTFYGILKPGALLLVTLNVFGVVSQLVYITLFLLFAPPKVRARTARLVVVLDVGFLGAAIWISTTFINDGGMRKSMIGILCATLDIIMYGSPLAALRTVVTTRSVEYMPFFLSLCIFLNGVAWTFYAILLKDLFVAVPNVAGLTLGAAQMVVYAIYRNPKQQQQQQQYREHLIP